MNILLTTSAAPVMTPFSTTEKRIPVGIAFLIAVLKKEGHKVFFIDNYLEPQPFIENDFLIKNSIDFVGISSNTICFRDTLRMLYLIQKLREYKKWNGKIIVGGPHTSVASETIPDFVDFIVQGEGERAIVDIINGNIRDRIIKYEPLNDLDSLPQPDWESFVGLNYDWGVDEFSGSPVFPMNTSRGCPFRCTFCSVGSIWGKRYNYFSAERIVADIQYLKSKYNAKGIYFREDNFTFNRKRVFEFCELLLKKNIKIKWLCETRVNNLDEDILKIMHRAGCNNLYLGLESGSQRILDYLKKDINVEQAEEVLRLCIKIGINTYGSFITGVPTETEEDRKKTQDFINKGLLNSYSINVFVGIPKSLLYEETLKCNLYEYIDDRGLVYLKGHNDLVDKYYNGNVLAKIPNKFCKDKYDYINDNFLVNNKYNPYSGLTPNFKTTNFILRHRFAEDFTNVETYHHTPLHILDLNCHLGFSSQRMQGSKNIITTITDSDEEIEYVKKHFKQRKFHLIKNDKINLPFNDNSYNMVFSFDIMEQFSRNELAEHIKEILRVLKKDGKFIGTYYVFLDELYKNDYLKPFTHQVLELPITTIDKLISKHFFDIQYFYVGKFLTFVATKTSLDNKSLECLLSKKKKRSLTDFLFLLNKDLIFFHQPTVARSIIQKLPLQFLIRPKILLLLLITFVPKTWLNKIRNNKYINNLWKKIKLS